jgi:phosphoenolpyruvate carboxykinase (ATP)
MLDQRTIWETPQAWEAAATSLAETFIKNFENFTDNEEGKRLVAVGPII